MRIVACDLKGNVHNLVETSLFCSVRAIAQVRDIFIFFDLRFSFSYASFSSAPFSFLLVLQLAQSPHFATVFAIFKGRALK